MILVPLDAPGVTINRLLPVFGYDHAPHGHAEITYDNVRVPAPISFGGRKRLCHCPGKTWARQNPSLHEDNGRCRKGAAGTMSAGFRSGQHLERRLLNRVSCRNGLRSQGLNIEQARLLTLKAAYMMDTVGNKEAKAEIAMIKVVAPNMALKVLDRLSRHLALLV